MLPAHWQQTASVPAPSSSALSRFRNEPNASSSYGSDPDLSFFLHAHLALEMS